MQLRDIDLDDNFIYFFQVKGRPIFKIGLTTNIDRRRESMQTNCPDLILYRGTISVKCQKMACSLEKFYHSLLRRYHRRGEWFDLSEKQAFDFLIEKATPKHPNWVYIEHFWAQELGEILPDYIEGHPYKERLYELNQFKED